MKKSNCINKRKRALSFRGSLTVEASIVFPIFFYAIMAICCFFGYMEVKGKIKAGMIETARELSSYGMLADSAAKLEKQELKDEEIDIDELPFVDEALLTGIFLSRVSRDPQIEHFVKGGTAGISLLDSDLVTKKSSISLVCSYTLKAPVPVFNLECIPVRQEIEYRYFTGYKVKSLLIKDEDGDEDSNKVYITETGSVYHNSMSCPSLRLSIKEVLASEVAQKRNHSGGKYYPCEKCAKGSIPGAVYITEDGDRYHYSLECSGLKRTVKEVDKDDLPDTYRECKRCKKKEE